MIYTVIPFLVVLQALISEAEEADLVPPANLCNLPEHLGYSGKNCILSPQIIKTKRLNLT